MNQHWKNWIGWSNVRQQLWDECPRAFYFRYIGRWEKGEQGRRLTRLASLRSLRTHGSYFLMDVIGTQLHHALLGRGTDQQLAAETLERKFDHIDRNRHRITEQVNLGRLEDEAVEAERVRCRRMLDNFLNTVWPAMSNSVPLEHGRILSYDVDGHRVWLNVDAAFRDGKDVVVSHIWPGLNGVRGNGGRGGNGGNGGGIHGRGGGDGPESGGNGGGRAKGGADEEDADGSAGSRKGRAGRPGRGREIGAPRGSRSEPMASEVAARALWAMKVYALPHERVRVERLDLARPNLTRVVTATPLELKRFKEKVSGMCGRWESISSDADAPPAPDVSRCASCSFATACAEGKAVLPA